MATDSTPPAPNPSPAKRQPRTESGDDNLGLPDPRVVNKWITILEKSTPQTIMLLVLASLFFIIRSDLKHDQDLAREAESRRTGELQRTITDEASRSRDAAKDAHALFLQEAERDRQAMQKAWDAVRQSNDISRELQRDVRENQASIKAMIEEVRKVKTMGGGQP